MQLKLHPFRETPASHMQKVCEPETSCFLGWRCPSGSSPKLSAGRSNVGYRYWPRMKQWLCMLQGILLSMRSPWLCWAFFTQPVIYNWGVRKSKDFKYPRDPIPCPTEWSSISSSASPLPIEHWSRIQGGFYLKSVCSRNAPAWFSLSEDLCGPSDQTSIPLCPIFLISPFPYLTTYSINVYWIFAYHVPDIILVPGAHEWTNQVLVLVVLTFYLCNRWLFWMDPKKT